MKKILLILLIFITSFTLFGRANHQKVYPLDSPLYKELEHLYLTEGYALPFSSYPYTDAEFRIALSNLNRDALSEKSKELYDKIVTTLDHTTGILTENFDLDFLIDFSIVGYTQTELEPTTTIHPITAIPFPSRIPSLSLDIEGWVAKNFYGYSKLSLGSFFWKSPYKGHIATNLPGFNEHLDFSFDDFDMNFPYRAALAVGGEHWNLILGREKLSWGNGLTGNLVISSHIPYHNMLRLTGYSNQIKYTFLASFFPHPMNYFEEGTLNVIDKTQQDKLKGLKVFLSHRLEWRLAQNRFSMALTESIMYQSEDNTFDLMVLNPLMFFHNYYIKGNANSSLALELNYTPFKNLTFYAQGILDEIAAPGEGGNRPNALGGILGWKTFFPTTKSSGFELTGEVVYTTPYLYLRNDGTNDNIQTSYGINFIVANRYFKAFNKQETVHYDRQFLGYPYGGDAIVADINLNYSHNSKWFVNYNLFYMAHGAFDANTPWAPEKNGNLFTPSKDPALAGNGKNAVSHTIVNSIMGSYYFNPNLNIFSQIDLISVYNNLNIETNSWFNNFRFMIGVRLFTLK